MAAVGQGTILSTKPMPKSAKGSRWLFLLTYVACCGILDRLGCHDYGRGFDTNDRVCPHDHDNGAYRVHGCVINVDCTAVVNQE